MSGSARHPEVAYAAGANRVHLNRRSEGRKLAAAFSFDDGARADLELAELLTKHSFKGAFQHPTPSG